MLSRVLLCALNFFFLNGVYSDQFARRCVTNPSAGGDKACWQELFLVSWTFISCRRCLLLYGKATLVPRCCMFVLI